MTQNPLIAPSPCPNKAPPFDRIHTEHFLSALQDAIEAARNQIEAIKHNPAPADFDNTIVALETSSEKLDHVLSVFYNQLAANGNDALQALTEQIGPQSAAFSSDIMLDPDLFARVKAVHDQKDSLTLTPEQQTLLDETYESFVRSGALLDEKQKARMREISERLSTLGPNFTNNVKKSMEAFRLHLTDENDLDGLPESTRSAARDAAAESDLEGWLITLDMPLYMPFMQYAARRDLREKIWRAFASRATQDGFDNSALILEIVKLRHERAQILGFKSHAAYVLEQRMAQTPENVEGFLTKLKTAYRPPAEKDLQALKDLARDLDDITDFKPWDVAYYAEKLKNRLFAFSAEDLRPYFPLEKVLDGMFAHFTKLFDLAFRPNADYPVWHKDVKAYDVYEQSTDHFIGTLYADFFPRTGKKDGAWKTSYRSQGLFEGQVERPVIAIVCNFTKPSGDTPSLLTHGEVETLFHEMGHAVHGLLSDVTYRSLSGTNVKWDFVELPSQIQENWTFERETLDMISGHYKTGEKIPADLVDKLNKARNFMGGWAGLRQISLGTLDMAWHTATPDQISDIAAFEDQALKDVTLFPRLAGTTSAAFSHIFAGGYAAGYYSYKWAEVLDADAFEAFLENGLYDRTTAEKYKTEILSNGGSEHPSVLYKRFRGRDPDPDAVLRRENLL